MVDRAMPRSCSTTAPASMTAVNNQNHSWVMSDRRSAPATAKNARSMRNMPRAKTVAQTITAFLSNRSTSVPKSMLHTETNSM